MKKRHLLAISAALVLSAGIAWSIAMAQAPAAAARPTSNIALIDISQVFENLPRFKAAMEEMKSDVSQAEEQVKGQRLQMQNQMQQLEALKNNPQDYKRLEEQLTQAQADLAVRINRQKKEFMQREATIYLTTYKEIQQELTYFCNQYGIEMVLRFSADDAQADRPDSVLAYINRPVVWYGANRDITKYITATLTQRQGAAPAGAAAAGAGQRPVGPAANRNTVPFNGMSR